MVHEKHLTVHAKKLLKEHKPKEDEPASYFCDKCGKEFMHRHALRGHVSYVHSEIVQCDICDYSCPKKKLVWILRQDAQDQAELDSA